MKKLISLVLSIIMIVISLTSYVYADTFDDMLKNAQDFNKLDFNFVPDYIKIPSYDFKYSNDMQNVTFDGKTTRVIYKANMITDGDVRLIDVSNDIEQFFLHNLDTDEIYNSMLNYKNNIAHNDMILKIPSFPASEPLYLDMFGNNGSPALWYNYTDEFKNFFINRFNEIINNNELSSTLKILNVSKDRINEFAKEYLSNPEEYTGYAGVVLFKGLDIDKARKDYNINNTPVAIYLDESYNSKDQFLNFPLKNTYIDAWKDAIFIYFKNLDTFKKALQEGDLINNEYSLFSIQILMKPNDNRILLNGQTPAADLIGGLGELTAKELPIAPIVKDGTTYVPVKGLFEELGAQVNYDDSTNTAIITKGKLTIKLKLGSNVVDVNGSKKQLSNNIFTVNDHVLIPLRFVSEALGYTVKWDNNTQQIKIEALDM